MKSLKCFSILLLVGLGAKVASAQTESPHIFANPPLLQADSEASVSRFSALSRSASGSAGEILLNLDVDYIENKIWNPATEQYDDVRLRGYRGKGVDPDDPYVAPTIEIKPGNTIRLTLNNKLPLDPSCLRWGQGVNVPHCFNGTNMHTHGLWVNPSGNGDNVLISINPGVSFQYEYKIPPDHPAGTFWYHPHRHGSTALQVSSGMAGALIIRGNRPPTIDTNGDIDVLLKPTAEQSFPERVLVFQQIQYACRDNKTGPIKTGPPGDVEGRWICDENDVGEIERYDGPAGPDQFGPGTWGQSGRFTSINGQVIPTFGEEKGPDDSVVRVGQIERWRMIHAGVRDTLNIRFLKLIDDVIESAKLSNDNFEEYCVGKPLNYHLIAADGLTGASAVSTKGAVLQPGYRWDALVVFPEARRYCVVDDEVPSDANVNNVRSTRRLLGIVEVVDAEEGGPIPSSDITKFLEDELIKASKENISPDPVSTTVIKDLADGLKLSSFVPHRDLSNLDANEIQGEQTLVFNIDVSEKPPKFEINGRPYDPDRIDRVLPLGAVQDWVLTSSLASHPFHIHVNPFQILWILDPNGKDVSRAGASDSDDGQYPGLKGTWKDTLFVKNGYTLVLRTHYRRYIGDFVLHCHILDHEDRGMMQNIRIALPDGQGGATYGHR